MGTSPFTGSKGILVFKKPHGLEIGEVILHTRPGSVEILECMVTDYGTSKAKGNWFCVIYANDPDVEVKLDQLEMDEVLAYRVMSAATFSRL